MRIGERLLEQRKLTPGELAQVVDEQPSRGRRLCSLLIARGLIDFDDGARALGEHKGVPCALAKHLANRDPELAKLLPAELGRAACALPIGKTSAGALIVCVRDPAPALLGSLRDATRAEVMMVIAPASRIEQLVHAEYGNDPDEFDIVVDSRIDVVPPPPDMDLLDPDSVRLALTDLDDTRVDKDPSQSGSMHLRRPTTLPPVGPSLETTRRDLAHAETRDAASDLALTFAATQWPAALLLALAGGTARGYRGYNVSHVEKITLPLRLPSTVQRAVESKQPSSQTPSGPAQDQLVQLLGAKTLAAAPVLVDGQVVAVLVVVSERNAGELGGLASALGEAYTRIRRT